LAGPVQAWWKEAERELPAGLLLPLEALQPVFALPPEAA
jgi:hypothetical protein